ncbi:MAG: hypothetical protein ACMUIE_04510 [Thermoplasmatota archaeon]
MPLLPGGIRGIEMPEPDVKGILKEINALQMDILERAWADIQAFDRVRWF